MKQGVILDFNGVILDDEVLHRRAYTTVLRNAGLSLSDAIYEEVFLGRTDEDGISLAMKRFPTLAKHMAADLLGQKQQTYLNMARSERGAQLYPGAKEVLRDLRACFTLGMVTGASSEKVRRTLETGGLLRYFDAIVASDNIALAKPDPAGYLLCLQRLGVPASAAVSVEDSPVGVRAAKEASLQCIAVLHTASRQALGEADLWIQKLSDLSPELVRSLLAVAE